MRKILDLGCGTNPQIHTKISGAIGVDIKPGLSDVVMDVMKIDEKFGKDYADTVYSLHLIEHLDPLALLEKINFVLKPGGQLILETPNAYSLSKIIRLLFRGTYSGSGSEHIIPFGVPELSNLLSQTGFKITSVEYVNTTVERHNLKLWELFSYYLAKGFPVFSLNIRVHAQKL